MMDKNCGNHAPLPQVEVQPKIEQYENILNEITRIDKTETEPVTPTEIKEVE